MHEARRRRGPGLAVLALCVLAPHRTVGLSAREWRGSAGLSPLVVGTHWPRSPADRLDAIARHHPDRTGRALARSESEPSGSGFAVLLCRATGDNLSGDRRGVGLA
jgi:hypothetical protein